MKLKNICYHIDDFSLNNISFEVNEGECFSIVGSSGSGKSVLLEIIAGFRKVHSGNIIHKKEDITNVKVQKRPFRIVFQDYYLFPHLFVFKNIEYGLKSSNIKKLERKQMVEEWAEKCNVLHLLNRSVDDLSGGEKQRVALARSVVTKPDILLLDEPLSSLDINLKEEFISLFRVLNKAGLTIIHVTHDFEEAAKLSHRIALIDNGEILQIGSLLDFYNLPLHPLVAKFAGHKNIFRANLSYNQANQLTQANIVDSDVSILISEKYSGDAYIFIPDEAIILSPDKQISSAPNSFLAVVLENICIGGRTQLKMDIGVLINVLVLNDMVKLLKIDINSKIFIRFNASSVGIIKQ